MMSSGSEGSPAARRPDSTRCRRHADGELERAAVDALRQWQYSTTLLKCEPIDVEMTVAVNFAGQR
jgi:hypothetical protein